MGSPSMGGSKRRLSSRGLGGALRQQRARLYIIRSLALYRDLNTNYFFSHKVLKKEEERIANEGSKGKRVSTGKVSGPDLKSFIQQFPVPSEAFLSQMNKQTRKFNKWRKGLRIRMCKQMFGLNGKEHGREE
ncbi:hypothetical protein JHK85_028657 [Glycine max]|nr:hypothetical protein JHK85_028657 [Glycine max]KAG5003982.1 hypothetical protein JHK86_028121 [Glycine max]